MTEDKDDFNAVDWSQLGDSNISMPVETALTPDMLAKRLIWDVAPCEIAVKVAAEMGLSPASEDVEDMEHEEAHARLSAVEPLSFLIDQLSLHAANVLVATLVVGNEATLSEEDRLEQAEKFSPLVQSAVVGVMAELMDLGLIHLPHLMAFRMETNE